MSFQARNTTYFYIAYILGRVLVALIKVGTVQTWKPEQFSGVISATVTAGSITFLVIDRLLFDKPHFQIWFHDKPVNQLSDKDIREKGFGIEVRNDGFRDAYSVQACSYEICMLKYRML